MTGWTLVQLSDALLNSVVSNHSFQISDFESKGAYKIYCIKSHQYHLLKYFLVIDKALRFPLQQTALIYSSLKLSQ